MIEAGEDLALLDEIFSRNFPVSRPGRRIFTGSFQPDTILNALGAIDHAEATFADTFEQLPACHASARKIGREDFREGNSRNAPPFIGCQHAAQLAAEIGVVRAMDGKEGLALAGGRLTAAEKSASNLSMREAGGAPESGTEGVIQPGSRKLPIPLGSDG